MTSSSRAGVLRHGDNLDPILESRDRWLLSKTTGDNFFEREPVSGALPFDRVDEDDSVLLS